MRHKVRVPKWGLTIEEVYVETWYKKVGDTVAAGEPLCAMDTSKTQTDLESPVAGTLTEIVAKEGDEPKVGDIVCIIEGP